MSNPAYWSAACAHLSKHDVVMAQLTARFADTALLSRGNAFETLLRSIVGQQISTAAADSIWSRLTQTLTPLVPTAVASLDDDRLRATGLSRQKVATLRRCADAFIDNHWHTDCHPLTKYQWPHIAATLLAIKGIGPWTIDMMAIFYACEPDVFPKTDIGVINGIKRLYGDDTDINALATRWQPYRTVATWFIWRSIDSVVVQY